MKKWIFLGAMCVLMSCAGYRLGNIPSAEMKGVKTIFVPVVKNDSYEPGLPVMVTNAILRRIDNDGTFSSSREGQADATLEVRVTRLTRSPLRRSREDVQVTDEYEVTLEAEATLTNLKSGKRIFTKRKVTGKTRYFVQDNLQEGERQALPSAADDLAVNLVKLVAEGW
ncbi:MAG: LptE family protein [bacterium]